MDEQFKKEIHALAQQIKSMHDQAVAAYTPENPRFERGGIVPPS